MFGSKSKKNIYKLKNKKTIHVQSYTLGGRPPVCNEIYTNNVVRYNTNTDMNHMILLVALCQ